MSISKILKRVTEKKLGEIDFERIDIEAPGIWMYRRSAGNKIQEIWIQKAQHRKGIEFLLDYMFYIQDIVDITRVFTPKLVHMIQQSGTHFIEYENENALECIIKEFTEVIIKKVLPIYENVVRPDQFPTPELEKEFYDNISTCAEQFQQRYHMTYETNVLKIKKCVRELEQLVDENGGLTGKELDEFLLCSSSYYAELLMRAYNGRWVKQEDPDIYYLEFLYKHKNASDPQPIESVSPLNVVFSYWDKPEIYRKTITADYTELIQRLGLE